MHLAASSKKPNKELVKYLLENKEIKQNLEAKDKAGWTPLHRAVFVGNLEILEELINQGADINSENNYKQTVLHISSSENPNKELIKYLLENKEIKQNLEAKDKDGCTALHRAAFAGNLEILEELIIQGADVNAENNDKQTVLHLALVSNKPNIDLVKYLLEDKEIKQRLEAKDKFGFTALHLASFYGSLEILKELIKQGADINAKNNDEETILHLAARSKKPNIDLVKYLLKNKDIKQKLEAKEKDGWAALHSAAFAGSLEILAELIKQGADINASNNDEETILHLAARAEKPNIELIKYLLENKGINQKLEAKDKNWLDSTT